VGGLDGVIYYLFRPYKGCHNDNALLKDSRLLERLEEEGEGFYIHGDLAYPLLLMLQFLFSKLKLSTPEKVYNQSMAKVRESVE